MKIIKEKHYSSYETKQIVGWCIKHDIEILNVDINQIPYYEDALPIGSVEFMRECMRQYQINEPCNITYPDALQTHLKRHIGKNEPLQCGMFVKPCKTKQFTGFVLKSVNDYDEHDLEQFLTLISICDCDIWNSELIQELKAEYRFYILENEIIGYGRYDDGPDEWEMPDIEFVKQMIKDYDNSPIAYTLDVGVSSIGNVLIEANDAWAIGLYKGTMNIDLYVKFLDARWKQIKND